MSENGPLEYLGRVYELNEEAREIGDPEVSEALDIVIKLVAKPDMPPQVATRLIVKLQAMAVQFKMQAKYYMIFNKDGVDAGKRKNFYLSLSESLKDLVDSLKYLAKVY